MLVKLLINIMKKPLSRSGTANERKFIIVPLYCNFTIKLRKFMEMT